MIIEKLKNDLLSIENPNETIEMELCLRYSLFCMEKIMQDLVKKYRNIHPMARHHDLQEALHFLNKGKSDLNQFLASLNHRGQGEKIIKFLGEKK